MQPNKPPAAPSRSLLGRLRPTAPVRSHNRMLGSIEDTGFSSEDIRLESRPASWMPVAIGSALSVLVLALVASAVFIKVDRVVTVPGRLKTLRSTQDVASTEQGVVSKVLVKENQLVRAGQPLVVLDPETLTAESASLVDRQGSLQANAIAELQRLEAAIGAANARLAGAQEQLTITNEQLARLRPLAQEGGYGQLNVLDTEKSRVELESSIRSTRAEITKLQAESAQNEALLAGELASNRSSLVATRNRLRQTVLKAPLDGTVLDLQAKPGLVARGTEPLLKLVPSDNLRAEVDLPDADLAFVRPGQRAEVEFSAYPRDRYGWLPAEVVSIGTDALPPAENSPVQTPRFPAKLQLSRQYLEADGQRYSLQAGMALTAHLKLDKVSILELLFSSFAGGARALRTIR